MSNLMCHSDKGHWHWQLSNTHNIQRGTDIYVRSKGLTLLPKFTKDVSPALRLCGNQEDTSCIQ